MKIQKMIWTSCAAVLIAAAQLSAQSAGLIVNSNPSGAQVEVTGDAELSGTTPTRFQQRLIGQYTVTVKKSGYESRTTKVTLDPSRETTVDATLNPKTAFKAGLRSVFIPGWGQRYSERPTKGFLFTATTVLAGGAFLLADANFSDKFDELEDIRTRRANETNFERKQQLFELEKTAQDKAYDAENVRRVTIGVFAGVWALNVLDALFFFPHNHDDDGATQKLTIAPQTNFENVGVQLSVAF
jgi:hypothetical protein